MSRKRDIMENNEILNQKEGQKIGEFIWPFYRFSAVIPNQISGDLFVWLYISLVVFVNETKNLPIDNYNDDVKTEAKKLIIEKLSNIIDHQTLEKIVSNAEKDFIDKGNIKQDTFSFLHTFENLFAENCESRMVYQDAVSGEVLPYFGDSSNIYDYVSKNNDENKKFTHQKVNNPTSRAIKKAYDQYMKLKKFNIVSLEYEVELEDQFIDKEEQTFIENDIEVNTFVEEKKETKSYKNMNVIPIRDTRVMINVLIPVYIKDNELSLRSPFGKITDNWLAKCMKKARNISEEMDSKIKTLEKTFCIDEKKIQNYIESNTKDFASTLKYCQTLYRLIDSLNDDQMRRNVVKLDLRFVEASIDEFYLQVGRILDGTVNRISYSSKSTADERLNTDFITFCNQIDNKFQNTSVSYRFIKSIHIFNDWKKKYTIGAGKEFYSFKADLTDIVLRTDLIKSRFIYDSFLDDAFKLYWNRNKPSHNDDKVVFNQVLIDKLTKVIKCLLELI